ncbi:hypothetical protein [Tautonia rosea]|uniref:hypothetical protein n=1 Tax=Tautonia rosea TaxID=2728037 RepID=UPI0014730F5B|nr:hypothetical protein [Tautonia rosea]
MTRTVRTVITFALLLAGYFGYEYGYSIVSARVQPSIPIAKARFDLRPSASLGAQQATELALRVFGEHHWTSGTVSDVTKYYNNDRGYWMYWSTLDFPDDQDRKRIVLAPFAVIWGSNKDGSTKVMSGDRAVIDFDQPFSFMGGGPKPNVVHAKIEGIDEHVLILDDKGTPDPQDDMVVTVPYAEYFEKQMQLRCDDQVQLVDGDVTVRGKGLVISLRPGDGGGGFPGAEVVTLNQGVEITSEDIGSSGFVPGNALPEQQVASADGVEAPKTPGKLTSGSMRLQLPKPRMPAPVGPPAPPAPTIAEFSTNVVIERGVEQPDRITGDHLYAILVPGAEPVAEDPSSVTEGALPPSGDQSSGALRLLEARVDGHVVWLESQSERLRCRGNELIYRKPGNNVPEVSYFRADPGQQIEFERMEVDEQGNPTSYVTVLAADATLHGDPEKQGRSTVITRGPVLLEMRSRRDGPVERSATARDEMVIETSLAAADAADETPRTFITLQGWPILNDPSQLTLACRDKVVVSLKPQDAGPVPVQGSEGEPKGRSFQIEWISAVGDVHLVTPEGSEGPAGMVVAGDRKPRRELNAREKLDVVFTYLNEVMPASDVMAGAAGQALPRARFASQVGGAPGAGASASESADPVVAGRPDAGQSGIEEPPSPPFSAEADLVWARIEVTGNGPGIDLTGGSGGTREVREARFRNNVVIHQDPAPGKKAGFHVDADFGIDLQNVGPGRMKLFAHGETRPVTIASDDMFIQGFPDPNADGKVVVGVDQSHDYAFIQGPGRLWNLSDRSSMGRLELASDNQDEAPAKNREPLIVTWQEAMFFHGQFAEPDGSPGPARALFLGDVKARNGDAGSASQEMEVIFDRPVSFDRALPGSETNGEVRDGDRELELASIIGTGQVELWNLVRDDENRELIRELRQSKGESVTFDRQADRFWMDGAGSVSVATLEGGPGGSGDSARRLIPTAAQNGRNPAGADAGSPRRMTLTKTKIEFNEGVEGQLGTAGGGYRVAEFRGDARVIRAAVKQYQDDLEFDRPPSDAVMLEGDTIYVEHNPAVPGIPDRNFLKAFGAAQARADGKTLLGDTITYDTNTANFFVRGTDSAPVTIASQGSFGQPTSRTTARALRYNTNTDESELLDPGSGIFFRPDSGFRLGAVKPPKEKEKPERERPKPRLPGRNDMERQGFSGN